MHNQPGRGIVATISHLACFLMLPWLSPHPLHHSQIKQVAIARANSEPLCGRCWGRETIERFRQLHPSTGPGAFRQRRSFVHNPLVLLAVLLSHGWKPGDSCCLATLVRLVCTEKLSASSFASNSYSSDETIVHITEVAMRVGQAARRTKHASTVLCWLNPLGRF